jgi:hypothetical protein
LLFGIDGNLIARVEIRIVPTKGIKLGVQSSGFGIGVEKISGSGTE